MQNAERERERERERIMIVLLVMLSCSTFKSVGFILFLYKSRKCYCDCKMASKPATA